MEPLSRKDWYNAIYTHIYISVVETHHPTQTFLLPRIVKTPTILFSTVNAMIEIRHFVLSIQTLQQKKQGKKQPYLTNEILTVTS